MSDEGLGYHFYVCSMPSGGPHGLVSKGQYDADPPPNRVILVNWPTASDPAVCGTVDVNSTGMGALFNFVKTTYGNCDKCLEDHGT